MREKNQNQNGLVLSMVALGVSAALATDVTVAQEPQRQSPQLEEITVTGSRIARPDYSANSPIVTVSEELFESTATIGVETVLNQLPMFVPQYNQFVSQNIQPSALGTPGASVVSLRGLGANRSLVLIDGRRGTPVNATNVIDTNSIPTSAIERVEIISGGASAVYGAEAMAGVVNFVLKDNFEGFQIDTQGGLTEQGDGEEYRFSALAGGNVAGDRGNFMIGIEYAKREQALQIDRDWRVEELRNPFLSGSNFGGITAPSVVNNTFNPFSQAVVDSLFPAVAPGRLPSTTATATPTNPVITNWYVNPTPNNTGTVFTGVWGGTGGFNNTTNGSLSSPGAYKYAGPLTSEECGDAPFRKAMADGSITENNCATRYSAPLDRYALFGRGHYQISDNVSAFLQGNLSRSHTETVFNFNPSGGAWNVQIPHGTAIYAGNAALGIPNSLNANGTTNASYLPGGAFGLNCAPTGGCTTSEVWPTSPEVTALLNSRPLPNSPFRVDQSLTFMPRRTTDSQTTTYQLILGLEGEVHDDWAWDTSVSFGETNNITNQPDYVGRERLRALVNRPNYGRGAVTIGNAEQLGIFGGRTECTTGLPVLNDFIPSADCIDAIRADIQNNTVTSQESVEANLTGSVFKLPAGEMGFAIGAAYRDNSFKFVGDSLTNANATTDQVLQLFPLRNSKGSQAVSEIYGELLIPLAKRFDIEVGSRYSDYDTSGSVDTYKFLIDWRMTDSARFRGGVNRATRAPNIAELFLQPTQSAGGFGAASAIYADPCTLNPATASPAPFGALSTDPAQAAQARSLCQALMGQTGSTLYYGQPLTSQPSTGGLGTTFTAGNPNVRPETADTMTAGFVIRSQSERAWLSGFQFTLDYYRIEIEDIIAVESPDEPYRRCLSLQNNPSGSASTASCLLISRDPTNGTGGTVDVIYTNAGHATFAGYDLQVDFAGDFDDLAGLRWIPGRGTMNLLINVPTEMKTRNSAASPEIDWKGTQGCALQLQCGGYDYEVSTTFGWQVNSWQASLRWGYVPSIDHSTAAANPNTTFIGVPDSTSVVSLSGSYQFTDNLLLRFGIDNLFDEEPPLEGGNPNATPLPLPPQSAGANFGVDFSQVPLGTYDPLGRRAFIGLNWKL
jgi:iron complex outermembrane recepter protein